MTLVSRDNKLCKCVTVKHRTVGHNPIDVQWFPDVKARRNEAIKDVWALLQGPKPDEVPLLCAEEFADVRVAKRTLQLTPDVLAQLPQIVTITLPKMEIQREGKADVLVAKTWSAPVSMEVSEVILEHIREPISLSPRVRQRHRIKRTHKHGVY